MDLTPFVDHLRHELMAAAEAGGADSLALADRLTATMESAVRLTLLNVLSEAMDQVSDLLASATVAVRLHGVEPRFEVTAQAGQISSSGADEVERAEGPVPGGHIRLQFPDVSSVEAAAAVFPTATADPSARALYIPTDGGLPTLRAVLARHDEASLDAETLTAHTAALDELFQTVNGCPLPGDDDRPAPTQLHS
ncbi:hypothetical protein [Streptomyces lanatus]|uniref:Histidine kinase n=1 Tax=Streptomyces lanatus TaxID=66900 RepID=A0ABV1Y539_9ACTN|nr:hypothetical protein [Streptomyces lanatus]GHH29345.1 hypothetical protein GCM10018780_87340 [Streptomyces lanatus]